jgi:hypothetical protein
MAKQANPRASRPAQSANPAADRSQAFASPLAVTLLPQRRARNKPRRKPAQMQITDLCFVPAVQQWRQAPEPDRRFDFTHPPATPANPIENHL